MPAYITFTTPRTTRPDPVALNAAVKTATSDPTAVLFPLEDGTYRGKKADDWTPTQIAAVQPILDTTPALTPQLEAQRFIDAIPIWAKAEALAIIDQLNVIRAALPSPLPPITPAQALAAIRAKAGTL